MGARALTRFGAPGIITNRARSTFGSRSQVAIPFLLFSCYINPETQNQNPKPIMCQRAWLVPVHTHTHTHTKHTQNTHTDAYGNNSLWVESAPFSFNHKPLELRCGQVARFYGNRCLHYTLPNDTPHTRITLDFRVGLSLSLLSLSPVSSLPPRPHSPKLNPKPLFRARNPAPFLDSLALVRKRVSRPENLGDSKSVLPHAVACWSLSVPGMPIRSLNPKA